AAQANAMAPLIKTLVNRALDIAEGFMTSTDSASFGLDLGGNGIKTTTMLQFVPDSYPAQLTAKLKNTNNSMLTGVPAGKYLMFYGMTLDPAVNTQVISDLTAPIMPDLQNAGDTGKQIASMI